MAVRWAVKVLLLDESDRLLLLRGEEKAGDEPVWFPVGGGIESGEDAVAAVLREIAEETGCREVRMGPEVWHRRHLYVWRGTETETDERWFVARTAHFTPSLQSLTDEERSYIIGSRWWSVEELVSTADPVLPPDLGVRLRDLLRDGVPMSPIDIGGCSVGSGEQAAR